MHARIFTTSRGVLFTFALGGFVADLHNFRHCLGLVHCHSFQGRDAPIATLVILDFTVVNYLYFDFFECCALCNEKLPNVNVEMSGHYCVDKFDD
jgi:hypothetical protein